MSTFFKIYVSLQNDYLLNLRGENHSHYPFPSKIPDLYTEIHQTLMIKITHTEYDILSSQVTNNIVKIPILYKTQYRPNEISITI